MFFSVFSAELGSSADTCRSCSLQVVVRRAENCRFHSCSSCLVVDMPVVAHDRSWRCRRCSSCAVWMSLCRRSDKFQLSVLTAGMRGRFFRALHSGAGPAVVSTGTRPPQLGAS